MAHLPSFMQPLYDQMKEDMSRQYACETA